MGRRLSPTGLICLLLAVSACTSTPAKSGSPSSAAEGNLVDTDGYSLLCGGAACSLPDGGVPSVLRRPLHLPTIGAGGVCPLSAEHRVTDRFGPAIGRGPVFAVGLIAEGPFPFEYPPGKDSDFYGSGWGGNKVLWVASSAYTGPVLIRGEQLDGPRSLGFSLGGPPAYTELQLPPGKAPRGNGGWREWPTETRL